MWHMHYIYLYSDHIGYTTNMHGLVRETFLFSCITFHNGILMKVHLFSCAVSE